MHKKTALLATTAFAALALAAPAQAAGSGWYLSVAGGANWLEDNSFFASAAGPDTLTVSTDSDAGWLVAGAVGYSLAQMVTPGLRVEVEVAYRENQVDGLFTAAPNAGLATGTLDFDHSALSVMANVWYDFDLGDFRPYIGGGIGWADIEADGNFADATPAVYPFDFSDDGFAWQAGGGINFRVSPNMQLGVGYRYFSGPEVTFAALPISAANSAAGELDYDSHSGTVTLTFGM